MNSCTLTELGLIPLLETTYPPILASFENVSNKKLTLHDHHEIRGAKFTSFAGWNMPVSYGSSLNEHPAVRQSVGLFDVSHMGEIEVTGAQAEEFLNFALTNDLRRCNIGQAQYFFTLHGERRHCGRFDCLSSRDR